jgi:hypothetical protein
MNGSIDGESVLWKSCHLEGFTTQNFIFESAANDLFDPSNLIVDTGHCG